MGREGGRQGPPTPGWTIAQWQLVCAEMLLWLPLPLALKILPGYSCLVESMPHQGHRASVPWPTHLAPAFPQFPKLARRPLSASSLPFALPSV